MYGDKFPQHTRKLQSQIISWVCKCEIDIIVQAHVELFSGDQSGPENILKVEVHHILSFCEYRFDHMACDNVMEQIQLALHSLFFYMCVSSPGMM